MVQAGGESIADGLMISDVQSNEGGQTARVGQEVSIAYKLARMAS